MMFHETKKIKNKQTNKQNPHKNVKNNNKKRKNNKEIKY
jgi:hypothetical protein